MPSLCNALLKCIEEACDIPGIRVDFSKKDTPTKLNRLFNGTGIRGLLERNGYRNLASVFSFVAAFFDQLQGVLKKHQT